MRMALRGLFVVVVCLFAGQSAAADLTQSSLSQCFGFRDSQLLRSSLEQTKQVVSQYFSDARSAVNDPVVIASRRPAYTWARETSLSCGVALGYLANGYVDEESVQKCDCFHQRFVSFR
jgi:hypothetical protein